jgi:poly-gamma-glutamate synthesis protein (capsule biosynthesis protein)
MANMGLSQTQPLSLFLCGDVMTGRGIDQALPHPGNPTLYESCVSDAREYVELAESVNGPIPRPVSFEYLWGDALAELEQAGAEVRIINLETAITCSNKHWPDKAVHYRMHPQNIDCLQAARIGACSLANNHVLDWGYPGLAETLQSLDEAGLAHAGAGHNQEEAAAPAVLEVPGKGRLLLFSFGSRTSGIPWDWGATRDRPGVNLLEDLSKATARRVARQMCRLKQKGDVLVASIHWGSNWGYEIPGNQLAFAHRLVEEGVDIIHGHSSHHVKAIEVFQDRLILHGCGDFLTDYEGISGYEEFHKELALVYLAKVDPSDGRLVALRLVPLQMRRFQLHRAPAGDAAWLCALLNRLGEPFNTQVQLADDNSLNLTGQG